MWRPPDSVLWGTACSLGGWPLDGLYYFAGLTNERGNVCGLMLHLERAVDPLLGGADGQKVFASVFKSLVQI